MAVVYPQATKTGRMTAVRTAIDSGGAAGRLELLTTEGAILATVTLDYPGDSTASIVNSTMTLAGFPKTVSASGSGTAALARIRTSAGVDVITGLSVGTVNTDVVLPNLVLYEGGSVTVTSAVFTHADSVTQTYPDGVNALSDPPTTDGSLTYFASQINLSGTAANRWIDTGIKPNGAWAVRSMIPGARDATQAEVEPGPADVGNFTGTAYDTLVNSCGAAWFPDRKQFIWFGGGHGGWPGNEVYWVDLPTMGWGRMTDPSPMERWPDGPVDWAWRTTDGTPTTNHTYNGIVAVPSEDAFYSIFGSPWPSGNFPNSDIWKFSLTTKTWEKVYTEALSPVTYARGSEAHYIPSVGKIAIGRPNFWRWFDPSDNTVGPILSSQSTLSNGNSVATDTGIYSFGSNGTCFYVAFADIGVNAPTSMNSGVIPRIRAHPRWLDIGHQWNSFFWDATREMVIAWSGSYTSEPTTGRTDVGKQVYAIDFAGDHLYEFVLSGGSWARSRSLGSFTKWQHITELDCYVGMNHIADVQGWQVFKPGTMTQLT